MLETFPVCLELISRPRVFLCSNRNGLLLSTITTSGKQMRNFLRSLGFVEVPKVVSHRDIKMIPALWPSRWYSITITKGD